MSDIQDRTQQYLCECGCGNKTSWNAMAGKWNGYRHGHAPRKPAGDSPSLCACGCGGLVTWSKLYHRWNKCVAGHVPGRLVIVTPRSSEAPACKCGCGGKVEWNVQRREWYSYIIGHLYKKNRPHRNPSLCACGCGQFVAWSDSKNRWNNFLQSHRDDSCNRDASERMRKYWTPLRRKQQSQRMREMNIKWWSDPKYAQIFMDSYNRRPNKLETLFDDLTIPAVKYVGDGSFWRTWPNGKNKNPDFRIFDKDGNPTKLIVEIFGDYWHAGDDVQLHMEMWHRLGYQCLVLWEHLIKEDQEAALDLVSDFAGFDIHVGQST